MTAPEPAVVPPGPPMVAPFREVIHNISQFGEHWSWRCGVQWTRASEGWTSGACRYDHVVDSWDELVEQATAHLAKWHGIAPACAVPDTGQDREPEHVVTQHWDAAGGDVLYRTCSCGEEWNRDEERCPEDDSDEDPHDGYSCAEIELSNGAMLDQLNEAWMWLARRGVERPREKRLVEHLRSLSPPDTGQARETDTVTTEIHNLLGPLAARSTPPDELTDAAEHVIRTNVRNGRPTSAHFVGLVLAALDQARTDGPAADTGQPGPDAMHVVSQHRGQEWRDVTPIRAWAEELVSHGGMNAAVGRGVLAKLDEGQPGPAADTVQAPDLAASESLYVALRRFAYAWETDTPDKAMWEEWRRAKDAMTAYREGARALLGTDTTPKAGDG